MSEAHPSRDAHTEPSVASREAPFEESLPAPLADTLRRAIEHEKHAVASLVSIFEDRRPAAQQQRAQVMDALRARARAPAAIVGLTGTPGSGKSTLLSRLVPALLEADGETSIAVLAIDPSSHVSKGSFLGDRTRMKLPPGERRLYFRSQASASDLGGLAPSSFDVCRLLAELYDGVLVETVGIGQSEIDIRHLAERVFLVLAPLGGDDVQFLKAGIMEVPHAFVLNKCDEKVAERSYHQLRSSLWLARPFDADEVPVYRTSAKTGQGIGTLVEAMRQVVLRRVASSSGPRRVVDVEASSTMREKEAHFFAKWVKDEWGRAGSAYLAGPLGGAPEYLATTRGFDRAAVGFDASFRLHLAASVRASHAST